MERTGIAAAIILDGINSTLHCIENARKYGGKPGESIPFEEFNF
jgi:hypothetical protein